MPHRSSRLETFGWVTAACLGIALLVALTVTARPGRATVREYPDVMRTYPFSDPNPIPAVGRIYPYYRFDGYTNTPVDRAWTVVELENAYLKVRVLPEIGGKIWTAIDKSSGRAFIYDNHVVKFRDIALRGPWTSGGIEPNYGIIGHTPNCATPVDYVARTNPDGSASVIIGVLDLLTRTPWRLEIRLPADGAYFTTTSFWHNATPIEQPYYTWMNAGIKAAGNLQLIYPGTNYLGHDGRAFPWPIEPQSGRDLSFYEQNDFGPYKSYHVVGRHTDFFGAYWHDEDFGMAHYARRDDKLGKKAWIWGLSRQGMIWERLLTDADGQYVEVQSGRLFNQAAAASTRTPFKHRGFEPYATDTWTEYWFPVKGTGGFVTANDHGALNVRRDGTRWRVAFSPVQAVSGPLEVLDGDRVVFSTPLSLAPLETWTRDVDVAVPPERLRVRIGGALMDYRADQTSDVLSRPLESPEGFDWGSAYGLYVQGKELVRQREYSQARAVLEASLEKDSTFTPALVELATLRSRALDDAGAFDLARRALAIDTYDPAANYVYALAADRLGRAADALDGLEVAAQSPQYQVAAWTALARLRLRRGEAAMAVDYATRALDEDKLNLEAQQLLALASRLTGNAAAARAAREAVLALDPLNHFVRFERALAGATAERRRAFAAGIRGDLPQETFLELAIWYHGLGRLQDAAGVLEAAPESASTLYWLAFVRHELGDSRWGDTLRRATAASPRLVFPFRPESVAVYRWAIGEQPAAWQPKYYLALVWWGLGEPGTARELLEACGTGPDYAPFYAARAAALVAVARDRSLADLVHAAELDRGEWRFGRLLVERYLADGALQRAVDTARTYYAAAPANYILGMLTAKAELASGAPREAADVLARLDVLPYEGATEGRRLHREAQMLLAIGDLRAGRARPALDRVQAAREWPEHLGAGKPYPEDVDERLEDWVEAACLERLGRTSEARTLVERLGATAARPGFGQVLAALALEKSGRSADARQALEAWAGREPDAAIVAWARQVFAGRRAPLPPAVKGNEEIRVLAALTKGE